MLVILTVPFVFLFWLVLWFLARRLERVALADWVRIGSPKGWAMTLGNINEEWKNWASNCRLILFIWSGEHATIDDRYLTTLIWVERALFVFGSIIVALPSFHISSARLIKAPGRTGLVETNFPPGRWSVSAFVSFTPATGSGSSPFQTTSRCEIANAKCCR
jgi:hypothetical protein